MARRNRTNWYIGGINSEKKDKVQYLKFDFLPEGTSYKLTLIAEGAHDKTFST